MNKKTYSKSEKHLNCICVAGDLGNAKNSGESEKEKVRE